MPTQLLRVNSDSLPAGFCFTTPQAVLDMYAQHLFVNLTNNSTFYSVGFAQPTPDQRTSPWLRLDGSNRPLGWYYYYNGGWRPVTPFRLGMMMDYNGSSSNFDSTGLGLIATDMDGWALCNGQNGTPNLADLFVVTASANTAGAWTSIVGGVAPAGQGGNSKYDLVQTDLGPLLGKSGDPKGGQPLLLEPGAPLFIKNAGGKNTVAQTAIPVPAWYALAKIAFVGY